MESSKPRQTICVSCSWSTLEPPTVGRGSIPPSWVAHGYPYDAQYIRERMRANFMESESFREVDAERLRRLQEFGIPPAIPEWDGWHTSSSIDVARIWHLIEEERRAPTPFRSLSSVAWLLLGEDPFAVPGIGPSPDQSSSELAEASQATASISDVGVADLLADSLPLLIAVGTLSLNTAAQSEDIVMAAARTSTAGGFNDPQTSVLAGGLTPPGGFNNPQVSIQTDGPTPLGGCNDPHAQLMAVDVQAEEGFNDPNAT